MFVCVGVIKVCVGVFVCGHLLIKHVSYMCVGVFSTTSKCTNMDTVNVCVQVDDCLSIETFSKGAHGVENRSVTRKN